MKLSGIPLLAKLVAEPTEMTFESLNAAAIRTVAGQRSHKWEEHFVCGFDENGELAGLALGAGIDDIFQSLLHEYGYSVTYKENEYVVAAWVGDELRSANNSF